MTNATTRTEVYRVVEFEREFMDVAGFDGSRLSPGEYIVLMENALHNARTLWCNNPSGMLCYLDNIRTALALGVACMERHGAPERPRPVSWPARK